ncbi:uncharacterized protein LOC142635258 [Castanea sativa]|uniref:uncharacterized protein LOC142635258 n=1 Tax=Castanea sativa TaxID=21020 RepID=UPI003F64D3A7
MGRPDVAGRMVQWAVELSQFDIDYRPRTAIKAQELADFVAEFTMTDQDLESNYWIVYTDRSSAVGIRRVGVILLSPMNDILRYEVQLQFPTTNNEARYEAVLTDLGIVKALGVGTLKLNYDSKLVVGQITQVPREENLEVDEIVRLASSDTNGGQLGLYMEVQHHPSIEGFDVTYIQSRGSWMDPIITYMRDDNLPTDPSEARKFKVRSSRFTILNDELYKRGFSQPYLKCLNPEDAAYVLSEIHEGFCGNHFGPWSLVG